MGASKVPRPQAPQEDHEVEDPAPQQRRRIERLRRRVATGRYRVDTDRLAERMLQKDWEETR